MADATDEADGGSRELIPHTGAVSIGEEQVQYTITLRSFATLYGTLHADVDRAFRDAEDAAKLGKIEDTQRARRNAARTLFAWIEAMVWSMKQTALSFDTLLCNNTFGAGQTAVLREREYRLEKSGKVTERDRWLPAKANLRFAFWAFGRPVQSDFELQAHGVEWEAYLRAVEVRDRLMHPKEAKHLEVTDEEYLRNLVMTWVWFRRVLREALDSVKVAVEKRTGLRIVVEQPSKPSGA